MGRAVLVSFVGVGLLLAIGVAADDDFGDEDSSIPQEVIVPPARDRGLESAANEFAQSLELGQQQTVATNIAEQTADLPFTVLASRLDGDGDGVSNEDERRLKTNALDPDTDGDSYLDGLEVVRGYNPLVASPDDKIDFTLTDLEEAQENTQLRITGVRLDRSSLTSFEAGPERSVLVITGAGPVTTVLALFVFSEEPRVLFVRTDETGRFRVVIDDALEEGSHRAYAALTDAGGRAVQVSAPYEFVRTADAIELPVVSTSPQAVSLGGTSKGNRWPPLLLGAGLLLIVPVAGLLLLWRRTGRRAAHRFADVPHDHGGSE